MEHSSTIEASWSRPTSEIVDALGSSTKGVSTSEAAKRLLRFGRQER